MPEVRRWYFCMSPEATYELADQIKASVLSAKRNTALEPVCIHSGLAPDMRDFLLSQGVELHEMFVPFVDEMEREIAPVEGFNKTICRGTYLKTFISLFEHRDEYVLYADIDTIFLKPINVPDHIRFLAASCEYDRYNWAYFNTGVMVLNVAAMRSMHQEIMSTIHQRMRTKIWASYEQGDYNSFFWMRWNHLQPEANWKPYWGRNDEAEVVHFHGPKAYEVVKLLLDGSGATSEYCENIIRNNLMSYIYYARMFHDYGELPRFDELLSRTPLSFEELKAIQSGHKATAAAVWDHLAATAERGELSLPI